MSVLKTQIVQALLATFLVLGFAFGCGIKRDDTTGATRQIVADLLKIKYSDVKPTTTLGDLGCDELDVVELIMAMEESFDISISEQEFESLPASDSWKDVTIGQIAELARGKRK